MVEDPLATIALPVVTTLGFAVAGAYAFNLAYENIDWVRDSTDWVAAKIDEGVDMVADKIGDAADWAGDKFNDGLEAVSDGLDSMVGTVKNWFWG